MKRFLLACLLTFLLAGCGIQTVEQYEQMQEEERSKEDVAQAIEEIIEKPVPVRDVEPQQKVEEIDVAVEEPAVEEAEPTQQQEQSVEQAAPASEPVEQTSAETEPAEEKPAAPIVKEQPVETKPMETQPAQATPEEAKPAETQPVEQQPVEQPKRYVTISIQVHSLLKHWEKLHPSLRSEKYVPASGFVLTPKRYELLSDKDTVWTILQRAVKEHKIHLEYEGANENIYNNVYIEGINHLYEFSAGPLSGWMYRVNGDYPNYGSSQYVVHDGDVIEWHYTVDLGRDLGVESP